MPANRRVQRSVRITLAVALLVAAALVVAGALVSRGALWLGSAAVFALVAGVAAARILSNELRAARIQNATDRAEQAQAYASLAARRATENSAFAAAMRQKVDDHGATLERLKATLRLAERRAELAEQAAERNTVALARAEQEIARLRATIAELEWEQPGLVDEVAAAEEQMTERGSHRVESGAHDEMPTVVDLLAWDERAEPAEARQRA
ncbi:MAG: hypothetical protein GEU96_01025 [Propionibacteriales bacterium]|nr:hypothetical protein [Propionibacteriales bacterium]